MTIQEASEAYQIPMHILREYESWGLCGAVKKVMGQWQYDDTDLERLSTIMTLHDIALGDDHAIFEIEVPGSWVGKTIGQLDVRKRYHVNIMAIKQQGKFSMTVITPDTALPADSSILVLGTQRDIQKCFHI